MSKTSRSSIRSVARYARRHCTTEPTPSNGEILRIVANVAASQLANASDSPWDEARRAVDALLPASEVRSTRSGDFVQGSAGVTSIDEPDALAWLYQYLRVPERGEAQGAAHSGGSKITGDGLLRSTQFFTEPYMTSYLVRHSLSCVVLGDDLSGLRSLRVVDPACGGGNFLVEAFDQLFDAVTTTGANAATVADILLSETLVGYDLDSTLAHIAGLSLYTHAARRVGQLPSTRPRVFGGEEGDERGFLARSPDPELRCALEALDEGTKRIVLTNPPFLGRRLMSRPLLAFLHDAYPESKGDLCVAFLLRIASLLGPGDAAGLVLQSAWLNLTSYADVRRKVLSSVRLSDCVDLGSGAFEDVAGEKTNVVLASFQGPSQDEAPTRFVRLVHAPLAAKKRSLEDGPHPDQIHHVDLEDLVPDSGTTDGVAYHVSGGLRQALRDLPPYREVANPMQGTSTGDNKRFVRYSWEVSAAEEEWRPVSKGGGYCKWVGLNRYVVRWGEDGELVKSNPGSALRNADRMSTTDLVYSDTGTLGLNVRRLRESQVFIASGPGIEVLHGSPDAHLAFLNSRVATYFVRALSPKLTISAGYLGRIPVPYGLLDDPQFADLGRLAAAAKERRLSTKLGNDEYLWLSRSPSCLHQAVTEALVADLEAEAERLTAEAAIEQRVVDAFGLSRAARTALEAEVGRPVGASDGELKGLTTEALDSALASALGSTAEYKGRRRRGRGKVGAEGPVEEIAVRERAAPGSVLSALRHVADDLHQTRRVYAEDLLHQSALFVLGFTADRTWSAQSLSFSELTSGIRSTLNVRDSELAKLDIPPLDVWILEHLGSLHAAAFYKRPILSVNGTVTLKRPTMTK